MWKVTACSSKNPAKISVCFSRNIILKVDDTDISKLSSCICMKISTNICQRILQIMTDSLKKNFTKKQWIQHFF